METTQSHPWLTAAGLISCLWFLKNIGGKKLNPNRLPHPPGPKGLPFLGAMFEVPSLSQKPWLVYDKWFKTYGDIIYFEILGQPFMILGSLKRTNDIFDKRSSNYSDRKLSSMLELMGWTFSVVRMPYGTMWRRHRRAFHEHFHVNAVQKYIPIQTKEIQVFLNRLLMTPENFIHHIRHAFAATVMNISYGLTVLEYDDPYITNAEESLRGLTEAGVPGAFLVDLLPILKHVPAWFPGAGFRRKAAHYAVVNTDLVDLPFKAVKREMAKGTAVPSVLTSLLEEFPGNEGLEKEEEEFISRNVAAIGYIAGVDTTVSSTETFFLAMAMYPEAQRKAQAEIDAIVGTNRLPDSNDRPHLPYVNAIIKESMRWQLVVPLGVAHMATDDDEYEGYFIPKGTVVIGAAWSILHDPEVFEAPGEFRRERYLKDGQINPSVRDPGVAVFGFGRRMCPGKHLGDVSLYSVVSSVLAVYNISAPMDEFGRPVQLQAKYKSGFLSSPVPFKCTIQPRSKVAESLIRGSSD
ncbi:uncharacterized protein LACBIDRAFT_189858 [Laccaria bicolor S238N-H82]|uniref:Predicted protein n=1 Tax=Laccaria bicolor (strain S238N-H82 / ATCC MYA-4686) TaxID=486041 RepID=B0D656_LACBS|nr:uncharacterized protein LACBIDRAFT_189858 [Laccaria bicolor S238N-H82]EDR09884.1 predicted protein [Laccaria bicolor S238N-H82]|eukprot:XP_001879269.1 predicted protein [Laccaria bicolor S238N-H82]